MPNAPADKMGAPVARRGLRQRLRIPPSPPPSPPPPSPPPPMHPHPSHPPRGQLLHSSLGDAPPQVTGALVCVLVLALLCLYTWVESLVRRFRAGPSADAILKKRQMVLIAAAFPRSDDPEFGGANDPLVGTGDASADFSTLHSLSELGLSEQALRLHTRILESRASAASDAAASGYAAKLVSRGAASALADAANLPMASSVPAGFTLAAPPGEPGYQSRYPRRDVARTKAVIATGDLWLTNVGLPPTNAKLGRPLSGTSAMGAFTPPLGNTRTCSQTALRRRKRPRTNSRKTFAPTAIACCLGWLMRRGRGRAARKEPITRALCPS